MATAGWLAIAWKSERLDRAYAVMYGLGAGFIGDEVGLLLTFGNYQSTLTYDFFIGAISASLLLLLVIRYRTLLKHELSYLTTREGLALTGVFVTGFSTILFAFNSLSLGTPLALVGIVVILRELFTKRDPVVEGRIPNGVTVVAALSILGGANLVVAGVFNIIYPEPSSAADFVGLAPAEITLVADILLVLAALAVIVGAFKVLTGLVLRSGKKWAWTLGMVASVLSLSLDASSLGAYSTITASSIEFPTSLLAIIYLTRLHVRAFYGRSPMSKREIVERVAIG
jgi:hypothetical protein